MANRRKQIEMSAEEQLQLLDEERVMIATTIGPRGWPHSMPLWYTVREGDLWAWTFGRSQKVKNLERDNRCTLLIETGHEYQELRGVQIETEGEVIRDPDVILDFAKELTVRYSEGIEEIEGDAAAGLEAQVPKRVAIHFHPVRTASWDHRKLGGIY